MLSRDAILKPAARRFTEVQLSSGETARFRSLTERERSEFEAGMLDGKGQLRKDRILSARRRLICLTLVDENGDPVLSPTDEAALADQDGKVMEELYQAAASHCGIRDADVEAISKN